MSRALIDKPAATERFDTVDRLVAAPQASDSDQPDILDEILRCLHALGAGLDPARSAPTTRVARNDRAEGRWR